MGSPTKVIAPEAAAQLVLSGDTLAISGFVGLAVPEQFLIALAERFDETGTPRDLTLVFAAAQGDGGERGLNHLAREGLVRRAIGAHWGLAPRAGTARARGTDRGLLPASGGGVAPVSRHRCRAGRGCSPGSAWARSWTRG